MRVNIVGDIDSESGIVKILDKLTDTGYRNYFEGESLTKLVIVLMCQNPNLNLKPRIRMSKIDKALYMDLIFDLDEFKQASQLEREKKVEEKLLEDVPATLSKYALKSFMLSKFVSDFKMQINKARLSVSS
jgi:hypothetical protein